MMLAIRPTTSANGISLVLTILGQALRPSRTARSFSKLIGYENNNNQYDCYVHGHDEGGNEIDRYRLPKYETESLTDLLLDRIEKEVARQEAGDEAPFFASLSVQPPHSPYIAPAEDMARHRAGTIKFHPNVPNIPHIREKAAVDLAGYYGQIENLDFHLGRVRQKLRDLGVDKDTYVMFFSDHGDMHYSHGYKEKSCPWEESIRIPSWLPVIYANALAIMIYRLAPSISPQRHLALPALKNQPTCRAIIMRRPWNHSNLCRYMASQTAFIFSTWCVKNIPTLLTANGAAWSPMMVGNTSAFQGHR